MDTLPKEIFISIISNLNQKDKFNCIQVCQKWFRIIISTSLYSKLEFKSLEQLHCAIPLFEANDFIGKQVQELGILGCDIDLVLLESLPILFPNIKQLNWREEQMNHHNLSNSSLIQLSQWSHLESIIDMPKSLYLSNILLNSGLLPQLKNLEVTFHYSITAQDNTNLLKSLIKKLSNAPTLENLTLGKVQISLVDLEQLHQNTPKLKQLSLTDAILTNEDIQQEDIIPAKEFKSFHFMPRNATYLRDEKNISSIVKWFEYMSKKYTHLCHLKVLANNKKLPQRDSKGLEDSIINALSNMPHIESYIMELYPITDQILSTLNQTNVQLKKMNLCIESEEKLQDDCSLLQFAKSTQALEALTVTGAPICDIYDDYILSHSIIRLSSHLNHLIDLRISNIPEGGFNLLVNILQNLNKLETLCFDGLEFEDEDDQIQYLPVNKCNIKKLDISVYPNSEYQLDHLNHNFEFILESCPVLEEFELSGGFYVYPCEGSFNLSLLKHKYLKSVIIDRSGADYNFIFDHIPINMGKCWNDYNNENTFEQEEEVFHFKLIWEGNMDLHLY